MALESIVFGEISQMEKDILYDITYMRNLKKCNKLVNIKKKKKQTHRERISGYQQGDGGEESETGVGE